MKSTGDSISFDELDHSLIQELQRNGRQTNLELALKLGVSETTIRRRIERLLNENVINIVAVPNLYKVGYGIKAIIVLEVELSKIDEIMGKLAKYPNVHYLAQSTGRYNMIFWALFPTTNDLGEFVRIDLAQMGGVLESSILTEVQLLKRSHEWVPSITKKAG